MHRLLTPNRFFSSLLGLMLVFVSSSALAQYQAKSLVSNLPKGGLYNDPLLQNAWGLAYGPTGPFWVSDEASGWSTLYDGAGTPQSLQVVIPAASGSGPGSPTGIVFNGSSEFAIDSWPSIFMFATLDGTIQGWSPSNDGGSQTLIAVTTPGASYTGLAITNYASGNSIFAADANNNKVDIYDGSFNLVSSFTDSQVPAGFAPFGIQDINGNVFVSYAATNGGPGGYIDIFSESGTLIRRFAHGEPLNQPWGFAVAPAQFGPLSGALLITNNVTYGNINAFDLKTGKFVSRMLGTDHKPLYLDGIWGIEFGGGTTANGATTSLYYTAGPNDANGFFGVINFQ
jgi:uncharacterized protein (TIGR03118 family)